MTRFLSGALLLAASACSTVEAQGGEAPPGDRPECIEMRGEARYRGLGYDHIVVLRSTCDKVADCRVSTNVNPEEQSVVVAAGATAEVVTFRGSPARVFTPRASCQLRN